MALYFQKEEEGVEPDKFMFPLALKVCGGIVSFQIREKIFLDAVRLGFANDRFVLKSLFDMYAKCGDILKARSVFDKIDSKEFVSWNIITICSIKGVSYSYHARERHRIMELMESEGILPDIITLVSLLSACANLRAGFIDEAYDIAKVGMGLAMGPTIWGALLYACYLHGNVVIGEIAAQKLFELERVNELNFELLMKIY
ncbi:hypothetical protein ACFE04_021071 [Oxalis oulophora]